MESILARALESTLKYWLKSFTRDQFKLQGRTVQLSNLDINGDALHASMGLPPAIHVTTARVGKFEIMLPSVSNVQIEPIVIQIDKLDLVLEEKSDSDERKSSSSTQSSSSSGRGSGYGFADKIADGMTIQVQTVNLLLETRGGAQQLGGATWAPPMASITIRNLSLCTTNEKWQVVNLKEARDFNTNKSYIYVFKKLEWESLSIDLLPHPDMFIDASQAGANKRDDDGAKRVFFGGERFLEGIYGQAYITVQRTDLNNPLGLEVQLHISEVISPALSEPGLRALLRFMTGLYVCLNRGDVDPNPQEISVDAAGRSKVSIIVDHIFLCVKDAEFRLELLMQSLNFSRTSVSDGKTAKLLTRIMVGGFFLRDTFLHPPCTLVQPSMESSEKEPLQSPGFVQDFCPPIYPLEDQQWQVMEGIPLICLHSLQVKPSPVPHSFASETVIDCQPLMIYLQEESCLRITSFLADGVVVSPGSILPDSSVNSLMFTLKELDVTVPLDMEKLSHPTTLSDTVFQDSFSGARLHINNMFFSEAPSLKLRLLKLEKDPACYCLWEDQPIDASQKKWTAGASCFALSLETSSDLTGAQNSLGCTSGSWRCVELKDACIEVAMATPDGSPLTKVPPPAGLVRVGVAFQQYMSETSVEQLFFVLDLYAYFGRVSEKIAIVGKKNRGKIIEYKTSSESLLDKVPSDTAVSLAVKDLQLRFLESSSVSSQRMPLVQFIGNELFIKVGHRTLGGAVLVSSVLCWESVQVDCLDTEQKLIHENEDVLTTTEDRLFTAGNGHNPKPQLRAVFWIHNKMMYQPKGKNKTVPFLDINVVHVIPLSAEDNECHSLSVSACISGIRLGGGMNYTEALLHRFGIIGPDGGPGEKLSKGLDYLHAGPFSKLFKSSSFHVDKLEDDGESGDQQEGNFLHLGKPDDIDVSIELKNWLFALEGVQELAESWSDSPKKIGREERCWHTTFQCLQLKAKTTPRHVQDGKQLRRMLKYPVESITVAVNGLQTLKPVFPGGIIQDGLPANGIDENITDSGGINVEANMVISEDNTDQEMIKWVVENVKFSVKQPIEAMVTKDELEHLALLSKSEFDSLGRITAGLLRILRLEGSVGQGTIDQLYNLGANGFDKIFSEKRSRGSSPCSIGFTPYSNSVNESAAPNAISTVVSIEEAVLDSQNRCTDLIAELNSSESSIQHLDSIKQINEKLERMQSLLTRLRMQL